MAKAGTLGKPKASSLKSLKPHKVSGHRLKKVKLVREILIEALMDNDLETFQDVLISHLKANSKSELAKKAGLGRQTLYDMMSEDREFNPSFKTLGAILEVLPAY